MVTTGMVGLQPSEIVKKYRMADRNPRELKHQNSRISQQASQLLSARFDPDVTHQQA